jgi:hypothetical protein
MPIVGTPISSSSGWVTVEDADQYFGTRHGIGTLWSDLSVAARTAVLTTAQRTIQFNDDYTFPDEVTQEMKDAVCEQVFFMLMDPDIEVRAALRAQGVVEAGLVLEKYRQAYGGDIPIAPLAKKYLRSLKNSDTHEIPLVR